ncbi:protein indeterminate-domain 7 isoform X1 [Cannabis sativa]|uniref:protein indeterminate-domain 7 isoform X1 n=2 Tax=Cannabis sativa TaxID=3483 RepID=UPI0029CA9FC2|nr:protein indeterminate-domain 7 isoform X1 [Cannabis sativa]
MIKGLMMVDDNISNLTFASSSEIVSASSSSTTTRNDQSLLGTTTTITMYPQNSSISTNHQELPLPSPPPPPNKKKRNHPGNPDPEAEVVALSPKTLLATNRFVCEICKKGFQRDQNLQLHRRGHNLPWKLKQRSNKDVIKKKVYVCPEISCVHHDPSRALGDLTGIKKHFFRKHGEKKWKCEKCSKRYAVQSDWKAHSKICGTKEYRCDCGTLFSRRDSFITHRAFCDALAQESTTTNPPPLPLVNHHFRHHNQGGPAIKREFQDIMAIPSWLTPPLPLPPQQPLMFSSSNNNNTASLLLNMQLPPPQPQPLPPSSSATALLQKAAQMGSTISSSSNTAHLHDYDHNHDDEQFINFVGNDYDDMMMMSSFSPPPQQLPPPPSGSSGGGNNNDGLTRDFLGLRKFSHRDIFNIVGLDHHHLHNNNHQKNNQPWQG